MWLSLVERLVRDQEVGCSSHLTPTTEYLQNKYSFCFSGCGSVCEQVKTIDDRFRAAIPHRARSIGSEARRATETTMRMGRDVRLVRDQEVGCSSHLTPTKEKSKSQDLLFSFFSHIGKTAIFVNLYLHFHCIFWLPHHCLRKQNSS